MNYLLLNEVTSSIATPDIWFSLFVLQLTNNDKHFYSNLLSIRMLRNQLLLERS